MLLPLSMDLHGAADSWELPRGAMLAVEGAGIGTAGLCWFMFAPSATWMENWPKQAYGRSS